MDLGTLDSWETKLRTVVGRREMTPAEVQMLAAIDGLRKQVRAPYFTTQEVDDASRT